MLSKKILISVLCVAALLTAEAIAWAQQANAPRQTAQAAVKTASPAGGLMDKRALDALK